MKETFLVVTARDISAPMLAEIAQWIGGFSGKPDDDEEFLRKVWREVGDDLDHAMERYPLEQAAREAGYSLPAA